MRYERKIEAHQVNALRQAIGFRQLHLDQVQMGIEGSSMVLAAYDDQTLVAMARLIWDGGGQALISDLICTRAYRDQGIEEDMVDQILIFLRDQLKPGYGIQVDIKAWQGQVDLLARGGFIPSTPDKRGHSMHVCLTKDIDLTDRHYRQMAYKGGPDEG